MPPEPDESADATPGADAPPGHGGEAHPDATGEAVADRPEGPGAYAKQYARDHVVHVGVVVAFALYPAVFSYLLSTPLGDEFAVLLPPLRTMIAVFYVGLFAMSFDFVSGYTGYLSFGHAMFYGSGAYFVVMAANGKLPLVGAGTSFMVLIVAAAVLGALLALLVGSVSFRLTGVYFAMVTLGFAEVTHVFVRNWGRVSENPRDGAAVTSPEGFELGVPFVDSLQFAIGRLVGDSFENALGLGVEIGTAELSYYLIGAVALLCYFAMQRIIHSPFGRVMVAIRENEERARAIGYDTFWYKMGAFAISGAFAAVGGALFAGYRRSVAPENTYDLFVTADALLAAIIGGFGTLAGPLYGHLFHEFVGGILTTESHGLARYLRETLPESALSADLAGVTLLEVVNVLVDGRASLYLGIIFIAFVLFVPRGIVGTLRDRLGGTVAATLPDQVRRYLP
ncbi:branched-chain amino acid ABC transporter permease [Haloparvum sp. PAK95]|uniref:branched-chain amino acid ABC transporter permease n=1 Tax=Haloparvum sp. PAK95 TaxID=3418962 RepID=UPI003D2EB389